MRRLLILMVLCALTVATQGDPARSRPPELTPDPVGTDLVSADLSFPLVAKNQYRGWSPGTDDAQCLIYPDGTSNCNYSFDVCNCKRRCETGAITCKFTGDWIDKCRIGTDNLCHVCQRQDCGG